VLHARAEGALASRELLQFGAEVYGHAGLEADLEVIDLALDALGEAGLTGLQLDLGDARLLRGVLSGVPLDAVALSELVGALTRKDVATLSQLGAALPTASRDGLLALTRLYGGAEVLAAARDGLPSREPIRRALDDLSWLAQQVTHSHSEVRVGFDLADMSGYTYYSGSRFALFADRAAEAVARGGRYDEVGAVFGRNRPAVGFSLDLKTLADVAPASQAHAAVRAPWSEDVALRSAVRRMRAEGHTVVCTLPGHEHEAMDYDCDREMVAVDGRWVLRALDRS
jgi:ATP phosphoribosyltransferase regulatory subunit